MLISTKGYEPHQIFTRKMVYVTSNLSPHFNDMDEDELVAEAKPTETDWKLRIRLWQEYRMIMTEVQNGNPIRRIRNDKICEGICQPNYLLLRLDKPVKAAFIMRPMQDFEQETETQLSIASKRLWDLLNMDISNPKTGDVDPIKGSLLLRTIGMVADRARGIAIARSQSVNVSVTKHETKPAKALDTQEQIDKRLQELEAKIKGSGEIIDVNTGRDSVSKKAKNKAART